MKHAKYTVKPTTQFKKDCECHVLLDWLLIYRIEDDVLVLTLSRTGSHSDLFEK